MPLNKRERDYLERIKARCVILRSIVNADSSEQIRNEWLRELHALEWAIARLDQSTPQE
jgi:hypothetical protein